MPVKIEKDNSLTISGFEGIGQSVLSDFSDALGVNLEIPGVVGSGYKLNKFTETKSAVNFSIGGAGQSYFTLSTADKTLHYAPVKLTTTGTLPTGLNTTDIFYLWDVNSDGLTFRFCDSMQDIGSSFITLSDTGTGTHSFTRQTPRMITDYTFDTYNNLYVLDDDQRVWFSQLSEYQNYYLLEGNTSGGSGNGIVYYKGYVIVFGNSKLDALAEINSISSALTWTNDFASAYSTQSTANFRLGSFGARPFLSKWDGAIYFGNGVVGTKYYRFGMLEENDGQTFAPGTGATFTIVPDAFTLPYSNGTGYVQSINEIGEYMVVGTASEEIYFWDRRSTLPSYILTMPEKNTPAIIVKGSDVFAFNGYNGVCYIINSQSYAPLFEIPKHLFNQYYSSSVGFGGRRGIIFYTDACLFGDEVLFATEFNGYSYIFSYDFNTKNLIKKVISSYGEILTDTFVTGRFYTLIPIKDNLLVGTVDRDSGAYKYSIEGWQYNPTIGSGSNYHKVYDNYESYIQTGLISLGTYNDKKTLRNIYISLLEELKDGEGIKVEFRRDFNDNWTELKTIDYTTHGAIKDFQIQSPITDIIDLQIRISFKGVNGEQATTSPLLKMLRLLS